MTPKENLIRGMDLEIYKMRPIFRKHDTHKENPQGFSFLMRGRGRVGKQISGPYSSTSKVRSSDTKNKGKDKREMWSI